MCTAAAGGAPSLAAAAGRFAPGVPVCTLADTHMTPEDKTKRQLSFGSETCLLLLQTFELVYTFSEAQHATGKVNMQWLVFINALGKTAGPAEARRTAS